MVSLRDGEALRRREDNAWGRSWLAGPHLAGLPKILTLGNGVGRCPAIMREIRQLCLEMSGQRLNATCWKKKKCSDTVPTGHIAVHVKINSSLCKLHGALCLPISKFGECILCCLSSPAAMQTLAVPLPLIGLEHVLFKRPRTHCSNFFNVILLVQSKQCLF